MPHSIVMMISPQNASSFSSMCSSLSKVYANAVNIFTVVEFKKHSHMELLPKGELAGAASPERYRLMDVKRSEDDVVPDRGAKSRKSMLEV